MKLAEAQVICEKVFDLPLSTISASPRVTYIKETFTDNPGGFCLFVGVMQSTLSRIKMRRDEAVSIMADVALAALSIGREEVLYYSLGVSVPLRNCGKSESEEQGVVA